MLFFMVFLIFCKVTHVTNKNAGSAIFDSSKLKTNCWTIDDIAKLQARKAFEDIIPSTVIPEKVSTRYIKKILRYLKNAVKIVQTDDDSHNTGILKEALYDTIGAHLHTEILPTVRFAYYAGYIPYRSAREAHNFFEQIKIGLNTHGVGWKPPPKVPPWSNLTVAKIVVGSGKLLDPCMHLVIRRDANNCIHLPSPKTDDQREPSAIALPFKRQGLVSLTSPVSQNVILKYYTTAFRCILKKSPANCRHADFLNFNNDMWQWMKRDVAPHLMDSKLYSAYGGVFRIAAAVQNYGKGLTRRNLFDSKDSVVSKWNPWISLSKSCKNISTGWSPMVYVALVVMSAITICLFQICVNYLCGHFMACRCSSKPKDTKDVGYAKIDSSTFLTGWPDRSIASGCCSNKKRTKRNPNSKCSSLGSLRTQRVYDLNENKEKLMTIIVSGNEDSDIASTSKVESDECRQKPVVKTLESRPESPPKIETTTAQLTLEKAAKTTRSEKRFSRPMYSTSTLTRSDGAYCSGVRPSESVWSVSSSSTSGKSITSTTSKSRSQRSRSSRDLAWARHVIARHSRRGMQSSGTELDGHSFITPPSRR